MFFLYPEVRCPVEIMVLAMVLGCLLPGWIVFGRGRWFVRATMAIVMISALLPIRAYQPLLMFVVTMMTSVALLMPLRVWVERTSRPPPDVAPEPHQRAVWVMALVLIACLMTALYFLDRIVARTPAMGWREMSFVFASVFSLALLVVCSLDERKRSGVLATPDIGDNVKRSLGLKFSVRGTLMATGMIALAASLATYALRNDPIVNYDGFLWLTLLIVLVTVLITIIMLVRCLPIQLCVFALFLAFITLSEYPLGSALR